MAGIYIHIPFCRKACIYCDFHFSTLLRNKADLLQAITREIELRKNYLNGEQISSIYFGGGTPSVMTSSQVKMILGLIQRLFEVDEDAEITFEANPDDLDKTILKELKEIGINRLSVGIQSFNDEVLHWMNRSHNAEQAKRIVKEAQNLGFDNITVDLIYGIPNFKADYWSDQLELLLELDVPHVSLYALTLEKETVLDNWIKKGKSVGLDDRQAQQEFLLGSQVLRDHNYEHYELSNFTKAGYRAVHNSAYWKAQPYLGVGPAAHSFDGDSRQWNVSNNSLYQSAVEAGELNYEREDLSTADRINERIMTSLRTSEGLDLNMIDEDFGVEIRSHIMNESKSLLSDQRLALEGDRLYIPQTQRFFSDGIAASLFYI